MREVRVDCRRCDGAVVFVVYERDESPILERMAEFVRHEGGRWCPYAHTETRLEAPEYQDMRLEALVQ